MKTCETCGKKLFDPSEEFTVNGILQCESCAYPGRTSITSSVKSKGSWAKTLKSIGTLNIFVGIISSLFFGVLVYEVDESFWTALVVVILGITLSVLSSSLLMAFAELSENVSIISYLIESEDKRKQ
ncbi:MAG: hypothetical protein ACI4VI_06955 [Acutalibacteraceae bacterium]